MKKGVPMSVNALNTAVTGLQTNQFRVDTTANNIANVNTDGFQSRTVQSSDRAYINSIGSGTQVASTYTNARPGPIAPATQAGTGVEVMGGGSGGRSGMVEMSNTDMAREMTNMNASRAAYSINAVMGRTADEMTRTILDIQA